ncbi:hypothetical protein D3C81_1521280 [compost metagenome]
MAAGQGNAFEAQFEHQGRCHAAHGAERFHGGFADDRVNLAHLFVAQPRIGLGEWDQCSSGRAGGRVPDGEGVVAVEAGAAAMATLGVDQHGIDAEGVDLPLPPGAHVFGAPHAIQGLALLEHQAFDAQAAGLLALFGQLGPGLPFEQGRQQHGR